MHLMGAGRSARRGNAGGRGAAVLAGLRAKSALVLGDCRSPHLSNFPETGALFAMEDTRWDHALRVADGGAGLVGHVGAVLLRKVSDQAGLTAGLGSALRKTGISPVLDRGIVLVSVAAAIALGATSMSDIAVLAHLGPGARGRAERADGAAGPGLGRLCGHAGPDRPRPGERPRARVDADRRHRRRVPVAGYRREDPDGLAGDRPGRHLGHRPLTCAGWTRKARLRPGRKATASTRWAPGSPIPASAWLCCCAPAT
jgi:hypothetical protein